MISKYTKNSKIHQALDRLYREPMAPGELRRAIEFKESMSKFDASIIVPLTNDRCILRKEQKYFITPRGQEKLMELGRIKKYLTPVTRHIGSGPYDGAELRKSVERPGADDHFKYPSRRNNWLYYRDGRVEVV